MITEAVVRTLAAALSGLTSLLPDVDLPYDSELDALASQIAGSLGVLDSFFPVYETATFLAWAFTVWLPVVLSFLVAKWVWQHLPVIGS